jgi:hypothetical protein
VKLDATAPQGLGFYHWGDVDLGRARIFARVAGTLRHRSLQPHLMDGAATGAGRRPSERERGALAELLKLGGTTAALVGRWLEQDVDFLEQESLDPRAPA